MAVSYPHAKAWVLVTACSYFAHTLYWFARSTRYNFFVLPSFEFITSIFGGLYLALALGLFLFMGIGALTIRFIGAINAVLASYLIWRRGMDTLPSVKGKIANALLCEGLYWGIFIVPIASLNVYTNNSLISPITIRFLTFSYSLQIILIAPFLIALSFKFRDQKFDIAAIAQSRLVWIACISYMAALWANYTIRWLELVAYHGLEAFFIEDAYIGILNSAVTPFFAVVFAVAGMLPILRRRGDPVLKWCSLSLTFLGLHFLIHILYTAYTGVLANALEYRLKFMLLSDVWPVTALGLGLYLLTKSRTKKSTTLKSTGIDKRYE